MLRIMQHHTIYSALLFTFSLAACAGEPARNWPEQVGKVLEEGTNKPIPGAIIVARWQGQTSSIADTRTTCYHVETATTDEQGIYRTTPWDEGFRHGVIHGKVVSIKVYKAGYEESDLTYDKIRSYRQNIYYLKYFKGTKGERLEYLKKLALRVCGSDEESKKITPFNKAILNEAKVLAETKADMKIINHLRYKVDRVELGGKESGKRIGEGRYR